MGVPIVSEANKSKELLLEIDSIVPDTKGHHLADISLSSNDSLSRSRRRWKLIKIISKMNPNFQGKSKKLIFYQSLCAVLSLILTGIVIYWLVQMRMASNSSSDQPSSSFLVSSRSSPSSSSPSSPSTSSSSSTTESPTTVTFGLPDNLDSFQFDPSSMFENPILRLLTGSNDTKDGAILKISDPVTDISDEGFEDGSFFPPNPIPSFPSDWFTSSFDNDPLIPPPSFQLVGPFESRLDLDTPIPDPFDEPFRPPPSIDLDQIKLSAQRLHKSAIEAFNSLMKKVKSSPLFDTLINVDELEPEFTMRSDVKEADDEPSIPDDAGQSDDTSERVFNFIKGMVF